MTSDAQPIDLDALRSALHSAVDNAIHWRDYCPGDGESREAWDADAKLLERAIPMLLAAPDLLAAAEDALWLFDQPPSDDLASDARRICKALRAAIAKATGAQS